MIGFREIRSMETLFASLFLDLLRFSTFRSGECVPGRPRDAGGELREDDVPIIIRQRRGIGDLIRPGLVVLDLSATNGSHDLNHLRTADLGKERLVETRATLLDARKMETSGVGDKLDQETVGWIRR